MTKRFNFEAGFSILEVFLVVLIIVILAGIIFSSLSPARNEKLLAGAVSEILSTLDEARARSLAGDLDQVYGVTFENDRIILVPDDSEIVLSDRVVISDIALAGGGSTVTFKKLTGGTDEPGTVTVELTDGSSEKVVEISSSGLFNLQ